METIGFLPSATGGYGSFSASQQGKNGRLGHAFPVDYRNKGTRSADFPHIT